MAIYHLHTQVIGRSSGKCAVASAAYRSGEKMYDERTGLAFDYTRKQNIDRTEIMAPLNAPEWVKDRETLWNQVEMVERRKDAQLARELNVALPRELTKGEQIELVRNFVQEQFVDKGMIADVAWHNLAGENPHAHIMLTTREITPEGFGKKNRDWNDRELHNEWREQWANYTNKALERSGSQERIDHRSLKEQGIQRDPQIHIGPIAAAMEKKGKRTDRGDQNRKIIDLNEYRKEHIKQVKELQKDIQEFQAEVIEFKKLREQKQAEPQQPKPQLQQPDLKEQIERARGAVNNTYDELIQQKKVVSGMNQEILKVKSRLHQVDTNQGYIQSVEEQLSKINSLNPFKRTEIKELKEQGEFHKKQIETILGEDTRVDLVKYLRILEKELPKEVAKLAEVETRHNHARHEFDGLAKKKRKLEHEKELTKGKEIHARMMSGETLTVQEYKLLINHAKELGIQSKDLPKAPKMMSKVQDFEMDR